MRPDLPVPSAQAPQQGASTPRQARPDLVGSADFEAKTKGMSHEQIVEMYRSLPQGDPMLPFFRKKISEPLPGETPEQADERAGGKSKTDNTISPFASFIMSSGNFPTSYFLDEATAGVKSAITGRPYEAVLGEMRQVQEMSNEQNPVSSLAGTIAGGFAMAPLSGTSAAYGVGRNMLIGGAEGAALGAVSGFGGGEGGFQNRASAAAEEGLYGLGFGVGAPLLGATARGIKAGVGAGAQKVKDVKNFYLNPQQFAEDQFVRAAAGDRINFNKLSQRENAAGRGAPPPRFMDEADMLAAEGAGQRVNVGDLGGDQARAVVKTASVASPEAADEILGAARARQLGQGERASQTVTDMFDGPGVNPAEVLDDLKARARAENKTNYDAAYNHPGAMNVWSDAIRNVTRPAVVQEAMAKAAKQVVEDGNVAGLKVGEPLFRAGADGKLDYSQDWGGASLHYWDYVGRALNDAVEAAKGPNGKWTHDAERISNYRKQLLSAVEDATRLDDGTSLFKQARSTAKEFFDAEDAHEAGLKYFQNQNAMNTARARRAIQEMTPSERELFARGYAASYLQKISSMGDERDVTRLLNNSNARMKLVDALGPERAARIEAHTIRSGVQRLMGDAVQRGSDTARNQYMLRQLGEQVGVGLGAGGVEAYLSGGVSGQTLLTGALFGVLRRKMGNVRQAKMEGYAKALSELVTSEDPDTIARIYARIQKDPELARITREVAAQGLARGATATATSQPPQGGVQTFKLGGAVKALTNAAKKAKSAPKPKLEGEALIEDWKWRPEQEVADELGLSGQDMPDEVQNFGYFMKEMSDKAASQGLSKRDLIKAFAITRSSIQRRAQKADKLRANGFDIPNAGETVRPEGAMAEWFFTPTGQRYLDSAEKGVIDEDAIVDFQKKFKPFGKAAKDVPDFMRGAVTTFDEDYVKQLSDLVARGGRGENVRNEWRAATSRLRGIGPAKKGFIGSMVGYGDMPTADARQLVLQTGRPSKEASKFMSRRKGKGGEAAVDRLAERQRNIGMKLPAELDPYYQHLAHHTIWDKTAGERTTHDDLMRAMRFAAMAGVIPAGVASQYISALEDEKNGVQTFSKGGLAQFAHAVGGIPFSGGSKGGVARAAMDFVTRALGTNDISETTLADIARMHNITPEQLATGYSALEHGAKSKKTGKPRDVIRNWKFKTSQGQQPLLKREAFNPNEMRVGDVWIPMHGDRTSLDVDIHEVEDVPLVSPTRTSGGIDFMLSDHQQQEGAMWRSDPNVITSLNNKADNAANVSRRIYGRDPNVYAAFINMGKRSGDYSGQPLDVAANMIPNMNISRDAIGAYNKKMEEFIGEKNASRAEDYDKSMSSYEKKREKLQSRLEKEMSALEKEKKPERRAKREERVAAVAEKLDSLVLPTRDDLPQWPGIENRLDLLHMIQQPTQGIGEVRKYATQLMDMPDFFDAGFPNMGAVRLATTKPELAAMDDYAHTGWLIGKREGFGDNAVERNPLLYHPSYAHNWKGRPAGGLAAALTDREFFERWAKLFKRRLGDKNDTPQAFYKSLANRRAYQLADQEFIDKLAALEEAARSRR